MTPSAYTKEQLISTETHMETKNWHGIDVENASEVCAVLNAASTCWSCTHNELCNIGWHQSVNNDADDAPRWGNDPRDTILYGVHTATVWSWDERGVVVGGDGTFDDDTPFVYRTFTEIADELSPENY